jgi:hypothetical protein
LRLRLYSGLKSVPEIDVEDTGEELEVELTTTMLMPKDLGSVPVLCKLMNKSYTEEEKANKADLNSPLSQLSKC